MTTRRWASRQLDALLGMVPIVLLWVSLEVGDRSAGRLGVPALLGSLVLGVAGFFLSRAILRAAFRRRLS